MLCAWQSALLTRPLDQHSHCAYEMMEPAGPSLETHMLIALKKRNSHADTPCHNWMKVLNFTFVIPTTLESPKCTVPSFHSFSRSLPPTLCLCLFLLLSLSFSVCLSPHQLSFSPRSLTAILKERDVLCSPAGLHTVPLPLPFFNRALVPGQPCPSNPRAYVALCTPVLNQSYPPDAGPSSGRLGTFQHRLAASRCFKDFPHRRLCELVTESPAHIQYPHIESKLRLICTKCKIRARLLRAAAK